MPEVCIPSYQRPHIISCYTLMFLYRQNYPVDKITIFVASEYEKGLYEEQVPRTLYGKIVVGVLGIRQQRNFITDYYPEGTLLLCLDDDVKDIKFLDPTYTFDNLVNYGVTCLETSGLFGIMPNSDGRKLNIHTTYHLAFILGSFHIRRNHKDIRITVPDKDDFEMTILYFKKYKSVVRFQGAGVCTRYGKTEGGLQQQDRNIKQQIAISYLVGTYPEYVKIIQKNSGTDLLLNWRATENTSEVSRA